MDAELEDLHQLSGSIFTNITCVGPLIKNLVANAKAFHKSFQGTIVIATQFFESLDAIAKMALNAKGATKNVGETLQDIMNIFCEIENMKKYMLDIFINEVVVSLESQADQEINTSKLNHKHYTQDNKMQAEIVNKATNEIVKLRKKSQRRKSKPGKYDAKEEELLDSLQASEKKLINLRQEGLRKALVGERHVYCLIASKLSNYGREISICSNKISTLLNEKTLEWNSIITKPNELPDASEDVVMRPSIYNTATMKRKDAKNAQAGLIKYNTIDARQPMMKIDESNIIAAIPPPPPLPNGTSKEQFANGCHAKNEQAGEMSATKRENQPAAYNMKQLNDEMRLSLISDWSNQKMMQKHRMKLQALYDHNAKDQSQLNFAKGDIINPISEEMSGWQYGENIRESKSGWFPAAYVQIVSQESSSSEYEDTSVKKRNSRRFSSPASPETPYIPAPDYDNSDCSDVEAGADAESNHNTSSKAFHASMSVPAMRLSHCEERPNVTIINTDPLLPLANAINNRNEMKSRNDGIESETLLPPPPQYIAEEEDEIESQQKGQIVTSENPFASVRLRKTVTNDRSKPRISN